MKRSGPSEARCRTLFETISEAFLLDEIICDARGSPVTCATWRSTLAPVWIERAALDRPDIN